MTQEELQAFSILSENFYSECERIAGILAGRYRDKHSENNIKYADNFVLDGDNVNWSGTEYYSPAEYEPHSGTFPAHYLTLSNQELQEIVEKDNEIFREEREQRRKEREAREKAARKAQYEALKKEFE